MPQDSDDALSGITARGESALKKTSALAVSMLMNVLYPARTVACRELRFFRIAYAIRHTAVSPVIINTLLISFLSTIIGIYEGRHGVSDVVPGYTAIQHRAEVLFDQQAEDLVEDSYQSLEEHTQNTMDELAVHLEQRENEMRHYNDEINALHADIITFNNAVAGAKDDAHTYALEESEIAASSVEKQALDIFDSLLLDAQMIPPHFVSKSTIRGDALIGLLSLSSDQANADIMAAHAAFLARKPGIEFPGPSARRAYSDTQTYDTLTGGSHYA